MLEIEYSQEVKLYFLDNYPYTFDLLVRIEQLKFPPEPIPPEGYEVLEPDYFMWVVLDHIVIFKKKDQQIYIAAIKPVE